MKKLFTAFQTAFTALRKGAVFSFTQVSTSDRRCSSLSKNLNTLS